jgi:predicted acylesterase/phospholipase RssA
MAREGEQLEPPFQKIALSLSGGGARAVGYHLGTLDYLHRINILQHVHILSTVSGGTLVGASYVLSLEEDIDFQDLFYDFFEFFPKANMFEGILAIINRKKLPTKKSRRNFVTAFAELYHEDFFGHYFARPYFGSIDTREAGPRRHLEDIIFNATEFKTGIAFRFQKSRHACKIGNGNIWIDDTQANEMRIADVVSASSCIPGGFEPFRFPQEFHWPDAYRLGEKQGTPFGSVQLQTTVASADSDAIALMDGGVYDNQGITSVLLAISRRVTDTDANFEDAEHHDPQSWANWAHDLLLQFSIVDLFIVSDTPLLKETLYSADDQPRKVPGRLARWLSRRTLGDVSRFAWIIAIVLLASAAASVFRLFETGQLAEMRDHLTEGVSGYLPFLYKGFATIIPLLVAGLLGGILLSIRTKLNQAAKSMEDKLPKFKHPPWYYLKHLRVSVIWGMLSQRVSSMLALSADIYMHRIRQLGYGILFSHKELIPTVMTNEIYSISPSKGVHSALPPQCEPVSANVRAVVDISSGMATKASFDELTPKSLERDLSFPVGDIDLSSLARRGDGEPRSDLDILTACGQITTCYNLIRYIQLKLGNVDRTGASSTAGLESLLASACADWNSLQAAPFKYVDERLERGRSELHAKQIAQNSARIAGVAPLQVANR